MTLIIDNPSSARKHSAELKDWFDNIYPLMFPSDNERAPVESILEQVDPGKDPCSAILLEEKDGKVIAGCISDYYPGCDCLHITYVAVLPEYRKKGIATKLINLTKDLFGNPPHTFVEVENPEENDNASGPMDNRERLEVYRKMGFATVPIHYIQPPLSPGQNPAGNLLLMHAGEELDRDTLMSFMEVFYESLDSELSEKLINDINKI